VSGQDGSPCRCRCVSTPDPAGWSAEDIQQDTFSKRVRGPWLEEYSASCACRPPATDRVKNHGSIVRGFTPTYVDLIALFTARAGPDDSRT